MLVKSFNRAWGKERINIEKRLSDRFENEIKSMDLAITNTREPEYKQELLKMRANLLLRKSLVGFESEEIACQRMQLRTSYLALFMSGTALLVAVTTLLIK